MSPKEDKKIYIVKCICTNCDKISPVFVSKGRLISDFLQYDRSICKSCGCTGTLIKSSY